LIFVVRFICFGGAKLDSSHRDRKTTKTATKSGKMSFLADRQNQARLRRAYRMTQDRAVPNCRPLVSARHPNGEKAAMQNT